MDERKAKQLNNYYWRQKLERNEEEQKGGRHEEKNKEWTRERKGELNNYRRKKLR